MASQSQEVGKVQPRENAPIVLATGETLADRIDYRQLKTPADIEKFFEDMGVATLMGADEFGDGFTLLENKDTLVGVPFGIAEFQFNSGDFGEFAVLRVFCMDGTNRRFAIVDGSTGIKEQSARFIEHVTGATPKIGQTYIQPIKCLSGLRKSEYTYQDEKGATKPATTYYLT